MTTIVNAPQPAPVTNEDNRNSLVPLFIVVMLVVLIIFFYFVLGALRSGVKTVQTGVQIPSKIDVNVNK